MTFDNEKNTGQSPQEPNPHLQRLILARDLAWQSDKNPASTPKQNLSLSRDILDALGPAAQTGDLAAINALEALEQVEQRVSDHLNGLEDRLRRLELRRNQRRS